MAAYTFTQADMVTLETNNAFITVNDVIATVGTTVNNYGDIFLKPKDGYLLNLSGCYFSGYDDYNYDDNFYFNGSNKSASLAMYDSYSYTTLHVATTPDPDYVPPTPEPTDDFIYTESLHATVSANHCTLLCNGVELEVNAGFNNGDILKLIPDSGYELVSASIISYDEYNYDNVQTFEDGLLTLNIPDGFSISSFNIDTTQIDIVTGANNLFKITKADLKQINIDRFETVGTSPPTTIDYGDNILGVINLPFNINPDYIQNPELIKLGKHETTVVAPKISIDKLYLDLGNIIVPMPENSLGFTNARALIHLPYANSLTLDINEVLGQIINIEYVIDLYNGNSYVNIKSDKSDSIIATSNVDLGVTIPYSSMQDNNNTVYNSNMSLGGDNHVKTPYIEIIQNIPILGNGFFTAPITAESTLTSEQGFIQVEEIKLNVTATSNEKDMILTALKSGVIIND